MTGMPCCFPQVAEQREGRLVGGGTHEGASTYEAAEAVREDPRVSSVLERLTQVESRVGTQLDQLVKLQQQQVPHPSCLSVCAVCLVVCQVCLLSLSLSSDPSDCLLVCLSVRLPDPRFQSSQTFTRIAHEESIKLSLGLDTVQHKIVLTCA